jgi:hypothetical protein
MVTGIEGVVGMKGNAEVYMEVVVTREKANKQKVMRVEC